MKNLVKEEINSLKGCRTAFFVWTTIALMIALVIISKCSKTEKIDSYIEVKVNENA